MYDFIVVGAGPSGSYSSHILSKSGFSVLNIEEHKEVGKPVECTGLVSGRVFSMVRSRSKVNDVTGANIYFPGGKPVHVEKQEKTIVMDRDTFDKDAAGMAISSGTDLRINSRARSVKTVENSVKMTYREDGNLKEVEARAIIGADGINSRVRRELFGNRPSRLVTAYQVDSAYAMEDQDSVDVFLGSDSSVGFFGWATPSGNITRIGVGSYRSAALKHFFNINRRFARDRILGINGGAIPISYLKNTYGERSLLVGDAAGIVKPLTGGGIFTGMVSGKHAARALIEAYEAEDFSRKFLSRYEKYWKKEIGRELFLDGLVQKYFSSLSDSALESIYRVLSKPQNVALINRLGDIDFPSRVIIGMMLRNPSLVKHLMLRK